MSESKEISKSLERLSRPWTSIGETPPSFSVLEVARNIRVNPTRVKRLIQDNKVLGVTINKNQSSEKGFKRAVRLADYRSRAPGGGPVIKRRVDEKSLAKKLKNIEITRTKVVLSNNEQETQNKNSNNRLIARYLGKAEQARSFLNKNNSEVNQNNVDNARKSTNALMDSIEKTSVVPWERPARIRQLFFEGFLNINTPIVINWICPRGTSLRYDPETERLYRLYTQTDPKDGFDSDYQFTQPKMILERKLARNVGGRLDKPSAIYLKIMADDNPYCLYPACLRIDGEKETMQAIAKYTNYSEQRFIKEMWPGAILVDTWSNLLGPEIFSKYLKIYEQTKIEDLLPYLPSNIIDIMTNILVDHTNPDPNLPLIAFRQFAIDCIRYFAVEGYFLDLIFFWIFQILFQ